MLPPEFHIPSSVTVIPDAKDTMQNYPVTVSFFLVLPGFENPGHDTVINGDTVLLPPWGQDTIWSKAATFILNPSLTFGAENITRYFTCEDSITTWLNPDCPECRIVWSERRLPDGIVKNYMPLASGDTVVLSSSGRSEIKYAVTMEDTNGCLISSHLEVNYGNCENEGGANLRSDAVSDINSTAAPQIKDIYPNPTLGEVILPDVTDACIFDGLGRIVYQAKQVNTLNLSLAPGIYFIRYDTDVVRQLVIVK